jgi:hypothetical protein
MATAASTSSTSLTQQPAWQELLAAVAAAKLHRDSKTFVDQPLKSTVAELGSAWAARRDACLADRDSLQRFLDAFFDAPGR